MAAEQLPVNSSSVDTPYDMWSIGCAISQEYQSLAHHLLGFKIRERNGTKKQIPRLSTEGRLIARELLAKPDGVTRKELVEILRANSVMGDNYRKFALRHMDNGISAIKKILNTSPELGNEYGLITGRCNKRTGDREYRLVCKRQES